MSEAAPIIDSHPEIIKPTSFETGLGGQVDKSEALEMGGYRVGDIIRFKKINSLSFGNLDMFSDAEDDERELKIIGISREGKLIVQWTIADAFIDQCSVEELNASRV
jgi:hypothetical protein